MREHERQKFEAPRALEKAEKEPEENTIYGSYKDEVDKYRRAIESGTFPLDALFVVPQSILLYEGGELLGHYMEKNEKDPQRFMPAMLHSSLSSRYSRYPNAGDAIDFSLLFDKEAIAQFRRKDPSIVLNVFHDTRSERLLELCDKKLVKKFSRQNPKVALDIFAHTGSETFLRMIDQESIRQYSRDFPEKALIFFDRIRTEEFFELLDKESIKEFFRTHPKEAVDKFVRSAFEPFLELWSDEVKEYAHSLPLTFLFEERAYNSFAVIGSEKFFDLLDKKALANFLQNHPVFFFNKFAAQMRLLKSLYAELNVDYPKEKERELQKRLKAELVDKNIKRVRMGFLSNETGAEISLSESEINVLERDLEDLYERHEEAARTGGADTIGAEIEVLNGEDAEIRPAVIDRLRLEDLMKFFKDFSVLTYQKFEELRNTSPEKFPGYPHSNLHLNFGLTKEQERAARGHQKIFEDITYCYSLAYSPFSRISYLMERNALLTIKNTVDTERLEKIDPRITARYQTRFFSLGGSKSEIKSSLAGIAKVCALLPELFNDPEKVERVKYFLEHDREIQNRALELRWIIEQVDELDEKRMQLSKNITAPKNAQAGEEQIKKAQAELRELDQKNAKFRTYFMRIQSMVQASLARFDATRET